MSKNLEKKSESVIKYVGANSLKLSYYELAKSKLEGEIADFEVAYSKANADYGNTYVFISSRMASPTNPCEGAEREELLERLSKLKDQCRRQRRS